MGEHNRSEAEEPGLNKPSTAPADGTVSSAYAPPPRRSGLLRNPTMLGVIVVVAVAVAVFVFVLIR